MRILMGWNVGGFRMAALVMLGLMFPSEGRSDGALAIGMSGDIAKDGLAFGRSWNYPDRADAEKRALEQCRSFEDAPQRTRDMCRLLATFKDECIAIVIDPKAGTPGFGWAVAGNSKTAQERAMAACKATAGKSREKFCEPDQVKCDGSSK